ncbi:MAG: hypothetical protein GY809_04540, partial [Planctomycetes bacterium]|nr:hypothetical protein [Planctomycetota bacterium]
ESSTTVIEIGGLTPGPGDPVDNGYDQINVTGDVLLAGTLNVVLINGYTPVVGHTFTFLTYTGSLLDGSDAGTDADGFDNATGLYGLGDGSFFFDLVVLADRMQLVVKSSSLQVDLSGDFFQITADNGSGMHATLWRDGDDLVLTDHVADDEVARKRVSEINPTTGASIVGGTQADILRLDTTGGLFGVPVDFDGGAGANELIGSDGATLWNITGTDMGNLDGVGVVDFTNVQNLTGSGASDTFVLAPAGSVTGTIKGGGGVDRLVIKNGSTNDITFDGGSETDAIVNQGGTSGALTTTYVETFIDRPLVFVHGFGGSGPADLESVDFDYWLLHRGMLPSELALEPLAQSYSDIVQTFVNLGYVDGTNLSGVVGTIYAAIWDYRVKIADTSDTNGDNILSDVTAASML